MQVPALRRISAIRTIVEAPELRTVNIHEESPYEIVRAICQDSTFRNPNDVRAALHAIVDYDTPGDGRVRGILQSGGAIPTRVHAELQIADLFSRNKSTEFADDDKYIGCSKPACYFCYNWLSNHHHVYVPPATHQKIIPGCRGPDNGINEAGAHFLEEMYDKMCKSLNQDLISFLLDPNSRNETTRHQYMSTEGSSRAPTQVVEGLL